LVVSVALGAFAALLTQHFYVRAGPLAVSDWDATWVGTRVLLQGGNPYAAITIPPWPWHLNYPLPALLISVPFAPFPLEVARGLFVGCATAAFTFVVTRRKWWGLYFAVSGAMLASWVPVAWSPLLVAAALVPSLAWLLVAKPTMGFALWAARPTWTGALGGAVLVIATIVLQPHWIQDWLHSVSGNPHRPLLVRPGGFLLLFGLLRWRRCDGRLLAALCLVPQTTSLYETLPLALVVQSRLQAVGFALLTMVANALHFAGPQGPWPIGAEYQWAVNAVLVYAPALVLVLSRPNAPAEMAW
jgi:hypothetical protein